MLVAAPVVILAKAVIQELYLEVLLRLQHLGMCRRSTAFIFI